MQNSQMLSNIEQENIHRKQFNFEPPANVIFSKSLFSLSSMFFIPEYLLFSIEN